MIPDQPKTPILCFDGDSAGRRAAQRAVERALPLLKAGHSLKIMFLPDGEDPDTYIRHKGATAFKTMLTQAHSLDTFLFDLEIQGQSLKTPEERAGLSARLEAHIERITERDVQYHYRAIMRNKTNAFLREINTRNNRYESYSNSGKKTPHSKQQSSNPLTSPNQAPIIMTQRILIAALICHPSLFADIEERLGAAELAHPALNRIRNEVFIVADTEIALDSKGLKSHLISVGLEEDLFYTLNDSVLTHAGFIKGAPEYHDLLKNWDMYWSMMEKQSEQSKISSHGAMN